MPCDGAVSVRVDDARSKEQKSESDAAIVQQGKTANAMERARLKEEARAIAQNKPAKLSVKAQSAPQADTGTTASSKGSVSKKKESEFFTAKEATPGNKK